MNLKDRLQNQVHWLDNGVAKLLLDAKECIEDFEFLIERIEDADNLSDVKNQAFNMRYRYFKEE